MTDDFLIEIADHLILKKGDPFYPQILFQEQEEKDADAIVVSVDLTAESKLCFEKAKEQALRIGQKGQWVVWHINWACPPLDFDDQSLFLALQLGWRHFAKMVQEEFSQITLGAIVWEGVASDLQDENRRGQFLTYLDLLASELPAQWPLFLLIDPLELKEVQLAAIFQEETFCRYLIAIKGDFAMHTHFSWLSDRIDCCQSSLLIKKGISLPLKLSDDGFNSLQQIADSLKEKGEGYRWLAEESIPFHWDLLDELYVIKSETSKQGARILNGFEAAGGVVVDVGPLL